MLKLYILMYADDICILSHTEEGLQNGLNILQGYCEKWKLSVNVTKTKVMVFKKAGRLKRGLRFTYNNLELEIVNEFSYLSVIFSSGGFFSNECLSRSGTKSNF